MVVWGGGYGGEAMGDLLEVLEGVLDEAAEGSVFLAGGEAGGEAAEVGEPGIEAGLQAGDFGRGEGLDILLCLAELGAEAVDGFADAGGVFGEDGDHFARDFEAVVVDLGLDAAVGFGRDGDDIGELEVGVAELLAVADDGLDALVGEAGVPEAEVFPGQAEEFVVAGLPDLFEGAGLLGGGFEGEGAEGLAAADGGTEGDDLGEVGDGGVFHVFSRRRGFLPNFRLAGGYGAGGDLVSEVIENRAQIFGGRL